jgi:polar amino acid transport system permease protein
MVLSTPFIRNGLRNKMYLGILPALLYGTLNTLLVFAITLLTTIPLAFVGSFVYYHGTKWIRKLLMLYISIIRGTPLLLQLMFVFFGLPYLGITLDRLTSVLLAFTINYTAYFMEILRGGLESIDIGQSEAGTVLGYTKLQIYYYLLMPQTIKIVLPSMTNETLTLIKDTALISVLGISELLKAGKNAVNAYSSALPFIYVGIIYYLLNLLFEQILRIIESKLNYYR